MQGLRLSDSNNYVVVKSFGGANISDMEDYLKPIIRKEPANLILHVGTNDLHKSLTTHQIAEGIVNLGIQNHLMLMAIRTSGFSSAGITRSHKVYEDVFIFVRYHRRPNLRMNDQVLRVFNGFYKQIYSQPKLF